jgi:putative intracellular protease/amidase
MRVLPDHTFANAPALDVLLVPGGIGTRTEQENPAMLEYLRRAAAGAQWVTSVCTGSALLAAAGLAKGGASRRTGRTSTRSGSATT